MISIGNIIPRKGYHNLIEALRNIDGDWELNIVGNEKMNVKYYMMIKSKIERYKLGSKIKFTGQTDDSKIKELILSEKKRKRVFRFFDSGRLLRVSILAWGHGVELLAR